MMNIDNEYEGYNQCAIFYDKYHSFTNNNDAMKYIID